MKIKIYAILLNVLEVYATNTKYSRIKSILIDKLLVLTGK